MIETAPQTGPFCFTEQDLAPQRLHEGVEHTLQDFFAWRDANSDIIAEHTAQYTEALGGIMTENSLSARIGRRLSPGRRRIHLKQDINREIGAFCILNQGELASPSDISDIYDGIHAKYPDIDGMMKLTSGEGDPIEGLRRYLPDLCDSGAYGWLSEQLTRLHGVLPEEVVREGGMGKVIRTMLGTLIIGAIDVQHEPEAIKRNHMSRILPAAYAYGAMYPIIDDTLQDSEYVSPEDKNRYDGTILHAIRTGVIDPTELPDHPLAEELERIAHYIFEAFPHDEYPNLYAAGESMFLAQDADSKKRPEEIAEAGLAAMYPDIVIKASMTRVVANIIGRRHLDDGYYGRSININFINQLRDDLQDRDGDKRAGRLTPFTFEPGPDDTNPLSDIFAYSAYVTHRVLGNHPGAAEFMVWHGAARIATELVSSPEKTKELIQYYRPTPETQEFLLRASTLPKPMARIMLPTDKRIELLLAGPYRNRLPTDVDPRTFISDRMDYIDQVVCGDDESDVEPNKLEEAMSYALRAGGKRIRPALTLMLAEGLGLDYAAFEPLMRTVEKFHTITLVFDDLPAQDNAMLRRGRPTTHIVHGEANAQLAGIAMISAGFGGLSELTAHYPAEKVVEVLDYLGKVCGSKGLCKGQEMDLAMEREKRPATIEAILEMYRLKTALLIEASLLPVLMLNGRPGTEQELIKSFSSSAGLVFQLRDDILDMTSSVSTLGKDAGNDEHKINIARTYGLDKAEELMGHHLDQALSSCQSLPFNTDLLQKLVRHFAARKK
jgi:geranylgeranyl pyrophosphate synthase